MSKRVANTRMSTARNGRIRYSWRRVANQTALAEKNEKDRLTSITRIHPKLTMWQKIKKHVRKFIHQSR